MSAIAAMLQLDGRPVDRDALGRMCDAAAAAGPDGGGAWVEASVGLGHRLLVTTPESREERQPRSLRGDVWIIADARIDNRGELIEALSALESFDRTAPTDDELILRAYDAWGLDCLPRLVGDFAFVIWDARRRQMLAVRDCFGIRPLHYFVDTRRILLASSIGQILTDPSVPRTLNDETVEDWLLTGRRKQRDATFYKAIRQVPAGHYVLFGSDGREQMRSYWEWRQPRPIRYRSRREYAEHLYAGFSDAVRARLRAVGPVGLFLSGGLDSSSIAGVAARVLRQEERPVKTLRTYSFVFDETPECDERQYIEPLVKHLGVESVYLRPERYEAFAPGRPGADEPDGLDAYEPWWTDALCDLRDHGGRVMLMGYGGETLLLSQSHLHFVDWFLSGHWGVLRRQLAAYRREKHRWPPLNWLGFASRVLPQSIYRALPPMPWTSMEPPWVKYAPTRRRQRVARWRAARAPWKFRSFAKQLAFEGLAGSAEAADMLGGHAHAAKRMGVEYAHPFMDRRLHQLVYALPLEQFFDGYLDRACLREAVKGMIPETVRARRQATFFDPWFGKHPPDGELRGIVKDLWIPQVARWVGRPAAELGEASRRYRRELVWLAYFLYWCRFSANYALQKGVGDGREAVIEEEERRGPGKGQAGLPATCGA